jgi:hypothetical protein
MSNNSIGSKIKNHIIGNHSLKLEFKDPDSNEDLSEGK